MISDGLKNNNFYLELFPWKPRLIIKKDRQLHRDLIIVTPLILRNSSLMKSKTQQRFSILRALNQANRPVTPQELLEVASTNSPGLGLATVYRVLKNLVDTRDARKIAIPGAAPHYEMDSDKHHHFFICKECERLFPLEGCPGGFRKLMPEGFSMDSHEVVLYGACKECNAT